LRRVCLLIDSRHGVKEPDRPILEMLDQAGISYQLILTKTDKPSSSELAATVERVAAELATHAAAHPEIHLTSAEKRRGIEALRATLAAFAPSSPLLLPAMAACDQSR
jgi:GTP-binding protein